MKKISNRRVKKLGEREREEEEKDFKRKRKIGIGGEVERKEH
jgi:hypothetical protein